MFRRSISGPTGPLAGLVLISVGLLRAGEPRTTPLPVPLTRPEMKKALEDLKGRPTRIPLPEVTEEEKAKLGDRLNYEGRLRYNYLPEGDERSSSRSSSTASRSNRENSDPNMSLTYEFKVQLFWIVSRTNNCLY
jgi:hypothetical protein